MILEQVQIVEEAGTRRDERVVRVVVVLTLVSRGAMDEEVELLTGPGEFSRVAQSLIV